MSQLNIQILHQDYVLTCPDGQEAQLLEAVERVDQQFQKMRDTSKLRSRERVGVLLAVNLAYENLELRQQLQALQQQLAQAQGMHAPMLDDADAQRLQALESQLQRDQELAQQLMQRLDAALAQAPDPVQACDAAASTTASALPVLASDTRHDIDNASVADIGASLASPSDQGMTQTITEVAAVASASVQPADATEHVDTNSGADAMSPNIFLETQETLQEPSKEAESL